MEKNKLFVANLPWSITTESLSELFSQFGEVVDCILVKDRETGRSKGFGFVTFSNEESAQAAIKGMANQKVEDRELVVNIAKPREERSNNRGGSGGYNRDYRR